MCPAVSRTSHASDLPLGDVSNASMSSGCVPTPASRILQASYTAFSLVHHVMFELVRMDPEIPPLDIPSNTFPTGQIPPGQFPLPFNMTYDIFPFHHHHHHHPPIYNIKRSTVNVYKIDSGRSIKVESTDYRQFSKKSPSSWVG